ncbi:MAG TPA: CBS domain-containing protein [Gaiellaceae bacterium]|nr:CBS domain-containing protein [Gaiellaceae bacterium]
MTANPRSVDPDTDVGEAARILRDENVGSLPVVRDGRVTGIVTDRDLAIRVLAEGRDPGSTRVADVVSGEPVTVRADQGLDEALRLMAHHQLRRLIVVEDSDRLVGILAQADVALTGDEERAGEVVEEISRPTD